MFFKKFWTRPLTKRTSVCYTGSVSLSAKLTNKKKGVDDVKPEIKSAADFLKKHGIDSFPIDLDKICQNEDIQIFAADLSALAEKDNTQVSGAIAISDEARVIYVNKEDVRVRQRFTVAHELGHYCLHNPDPELAMISLRFGRSPQETEANRFAAELLMPEEMLRNECKKTSLVFVPVIAKKFDVSREAMKIRLDYLGLEYIDI